MEPITAVIIPVAFFLMVTFVISLGSSGETFTAINTQINALNCPMPQFQGSPFPYPNPTSFTNMTYNTRSASNTTLTLTCTNVHTPNGFDYCYGCPASNTIGFFLFTFDYISEAVHKVTALFTIVGFAVTPPLEIPSSVSSLIFLFVYIPMYILLGFGIYKGVSPFA
jgi:hypothetical protein